MDYESKILFNRLIEAIDSPDGLTIALTIINTIAVVVIAGVQIWMQWQQTKLQKRQTEAQEYELYRKLACIIKETHFESKFVLSDIQWYLINQTPIQPGDNHWRMKVKKYNDLYQQLENCRVDIELKFSKSLIDIEAYNKVLTTMIYFSSLFEKILLNNKVKKSNMGMMTFKKPYHESVKKIAQKHISEEYQGPFVHYLSDFLNADDCINEEETIQKIKGRCIID